MKLIQGLNLALAFLLELAAVITYGYWGFGLQANAWVKGVVGIGLPLVLIIAWNRYFAPKASMRLDVPWLFAGKLIIFLTAAVLLYYSGKAQLGWTLVILAAINLLLALKWHQV